jgi:hypothetical protein
VFALNGTEIGIVATARVLVRAPLALSTRGTMWIASSRVTKSLCRNPSA